CSSDLRSYSARSFASIWRRSRSRRSCSSCRRVLRVTGLSVGTHRLERRNRSNRRRRAAASCSATAFSSRDPHTLCGGAISSGVAYSTTLPGMVFSNRTGKLISQVVADVGGGRSITQPPLRHVPYESDGTHGRDFYRIPDQVRYFGGGVEAARARVLVVGHPLLVPPGRVTHPPSHHRKDHRADRAGHIRASRLIQGALRD